MNLSFTNYNKALPQALLKQAQKLKVRDLDELNPKEFVAYVDDKSESFDVNLKLDAKKNVVSSSCDCDQGGSFCVHKTALLLHLSENVKTKAPAKARAKKLDPLEVLLNQTDAENLRAWLFPLLKKNSELKFLFEKEFTVSQKVFVVEDIEVIIEDAVKSVIGRRKSIQTNEVAKLTSMLEVALQPVLNFLENDITNVQHLLLILKINQNLSNFNEVKHVSSVKIVRLLEKINQQYFGNINNIQDIELWKKHLDVFFLHVLQSNKALSRSLFEVLKNSYDLSKLSPLKLDYFVSKIREWFYYSDKTLILHREDFSMFILDFYIENQILAKTPADLPVRTFADAYNTKLISALIELNEFKIAERKCKEVIKSNYSEIYNVPYWQLLKNIYRKTNDWIELASLIKMSIKYDFSLENLELLSQQLNPKEFKELTTKLKQYYRSNFYSQEDTAPRNYVTILAFEKDYKKLLVDFSSYFPIDMIFHLREALFTFNKKMFWDRLLEYTNYEEYKKIENREVVAALLDWAVKAFKSDFMAETDKNNYRVITSAFYRDFKKLLQEKSNN